MWTSGAVDMWITVAVQSPCQVPGLSLTPPGDHPAAGMRRSRRPGAARLRCAGDRNGARRWPRPDRKSSDTPHPGCANEPRPGAAASRGTAGCRTALRPAGPPGGRSRVPRSEGRAGGGPGAGGGRIGPRGDGPGPPGPPDWQAAQARKDAARDQARLPAAPEAQIAAAENARARPQARARHAEAEFQRAPTATRRPGRPVLDNPQAQPAAGALRETWRQATTSAEHPDLDVP